ncbi:hypothetical protein BN1723_020571, partial [Verticillium longisporum]
LSPARASQRSLPPFGPRRRPRLAPPCHHRPSDA